ncbi:LysR substrate-binding domain-containing protein [uncultured Methylobacterium sp.]|uniref:LysR substrate-binding domain-containing protein n=1 Tax=uncultured Methylobacterium sp. TaxID=157278 RepID=UPI0035CB4B22
MSALETAAANIRAFGAGRLSVAAMPRLAGGLLAHSVARFKDRYPDVIVSIHAGDEGAVRQWIESGFCDAGLTMAYGHEPSGPIEPVVRMDCVAVLPRDHPLAALDRLQPADFDGVPFIASPLGNPLRARIDSVFAEAGIHRPVIAEAGLGSAVCVLVAAGLGVSLMNPLAAHEEAKVCPIAIRPFAPALPVSFALLFPPLQVRSRIVTAFSACARAVLLEELGALPVHGCGDLRPDPPIHTTLRRCAP